MSSNTSSTPTSYARPGSLGMSPATRRPQPKEAPPAYSPAPPTYTDAISTPASATRTTCDASDDKYSFLGQFDTVFLVDDSGSMAGRGWRETSRALEQITPICTKWDADGIDIFFLNAPQQDHFSNVRSAEQVQRIFCEQKPYGATPTGTRLNQILRPYLRDLEAKGAANVKPLNIIVITDGEPSDDPEGVIIFAANKLEKLEAPSWQVGIQFFQVGNARFVGVLDKCEHCGGDVANNVVGVEYAPGNIRFLKLDAHPAEYDFDENDDYRCSNCI